MRYGTSIALPLDDESAYAVDYCTLSIMTKIEIAVLCDFTRLKSFGDNQDGSIYCLLSITISLNLIF